MSVMNAALTIESGPAFLIFGSVFFIVFYWLFLRKRKNSFLLNFIYLVMILYIFFVLQITLSPIPCNQAAIENLQALYSYERSNASLLNFTLFDGLQYVFMDTYISKWFYIRQYVLNIVMTIPFGLLLSLLKEEYKWKKVTVSTFFFSFGIEFTQFLFCVVFKAKAWSFDINDLITNTLGGVIGYLLCIIVKRVLFQIISKQAFYRKQENMIK